MKKIVFATLLVVMLLALTLSVTGAMDMEDPALCVSGEWLLVDAASSSAVQVVLPQGTAYGAGAGCALPPPNSVPVLSSNVVVERGSGHKIQVTVDGANASKPSITARYGAVSATKSNNGKQQVVFGFDLP